MKKIAYANAVADDKVRRFVPPVRVVRESAGVSDSAALLDGVHTQSFVHFNPRECVLPPGGEKTDGKNRPELCTKIRQAENPKPQSKR